MLWCCVILLTIKCTVHRLGHFARECPELTEERRDFKGSKNLHFSMISVSYCYFHIWYQEIPETVEEMVARMVAMGPASVTDATSNLSALAQNFLPQPGLPLQGWPLCQRVPQLHWSPTSWRPQGSYICQRRRQRLWKRGGQGRRQRIWNKQMSQV